MSIQQLARMTATSEFRRESRNKEPSVFCGMQVAGKEQQIICFSAISIFFFSCNTSLLHVVVDQLQPFLQHNDTEEKKRAGGTSPAVLLLEFVRRGAADTRRPGRQNKEHENSSLEDIFLERKVLPEQENASPHITPPSIIYITINNTSMAPQQSGLR